MTHDAQRSTHNAFNERHTTLDSRRMTHNAFIEAEVIGFKDDKILLMPLGDIRGIGPGSKITARGRQKYIRVGWNLLGRVLDGLGNPIDGKGSVSGQLYPVYKEPVNPLYRRRISEPLDIGIRSVNTMLTCGKGQRVGIMAGSGVGKSVLLGMMARNTTADVNVIALIGERGREVREFIEKDIGYEGLNRSVIVVATSDTSPLIRIRGAFVATAIAEYFRSHGKDVLFMMETERLRGLFDIQRALIRNSVGKGSPKIATIDQDAVIVESSKEEAKTTYKGHDGYQPLINYWAEEDLILKDEFRDGNVPAAYDCISCLIESVGMLPESVV